MSKRVTSSTNPQVSLPLSANLPSNTRQKKQLILRAKAATENGFETIGYFAAGVAAANHAGVRAPALNALSFGYVACRAVYNVAYVWLQADRRLCWVRSVVWTVGIGLITTFN
ncbi:uncharacterized protein NECHADRAFT_79118 [Fusarium vanettenii 77-13-4]|uniref:Uncharacterized protein n=1 Tax=Fusarium vanettenii (strain ATCC MYA-4622 / CBS 123669 / FGSC 9596 / NRRL 45880 / 77-13-4) TaxID=660122 RepID=C7YQI6_FUSV7|nr:uncharacterized protein NECHADRAFT_79118 [Fusarium vanettenii 77-13-4]EEU46029.1 hypothetical protein NECHADRAFT_79118 [Fusarium vanettenii 77-13-4]